MIRNAIDIIVTKSFDDETYKKVYDSLTQYKSPILATENVEEFDAHIKKSGVKLPAMCVSGEWFEFTVDNCKKVMEGSLLCTK